MRTTKRLTWWRIPALLAALVAFTLAGSGVWAYWSAGTGASGTGSAAAVSVGAGATPTAVSSGSSVTVSWAASTLTNGTAVSGYRVKRYNATTLAVQTLGSGCAGQIAALSCTESSVPNGQWEYTVTPLFATNWTGAESAMSAVAYTNPTAPTNAITLSNVTGDAALAGSTIYYNGAGAGSLTLTNAVADTGSGPASSSTSALGGTSTGWKTTPSTVSTPTGGPYVSTAFNWAAGATSSPTEIVTGRDLANNQVTTALTFVNDSTPPTGTISYTNGYQAGRSVTLTFTGADSGSGLANAQLQRSSANFVNGTCQAFGAFSNLGPANPVSPYTDSTVTNAMCYDYRYALTDVVGNTYTATSTSTAWVDYAGAVRYETTGILSQLRLGDSSLNGSVTAADSVGSLNPTYVNGVAEGAAGELPNDSNTAVTLDGVNDYIQDTTPTGLPTGAASRSVELWFKTSATTQQVLFAYGSFANAGEFGLWINAGGTGFTAWGWGGAYDSTFAAPASVEDGKWHQVVETYNGAALSVYLDGASLGSSTITRNTALNSYGLQIGEIVDPGDPNSGFNFKGSLDEFSIYSSALTQTDVTNHYLLGANTSADTSGPTGGSVTATGLAGTGLLYSTSTTLDLALAKGTDSTGVATTGAYLFRATATLTSAANGNGVCGTFGSYSLISTDPTTPYSDTVSDQACYAYRYSVPDTLGNYSTYSSGLIKVDTTAPSTPTLAASTLLNAYYSGGTLYYLGGAAGHFTLTATTTDTTSGIANYAFPTTLGAGWTTSVTGTARTYTFTATAASPGAQTVTVTNNAGSSAATNFTVTIDALDPTASVPSYPLAQAAAGTVTVTIGAVEDNESGLATTQLVYESARLTGGTNCGTYTVQTGTGVAVTGSSTHAATVATNTCYRFELVVTDNVGNKTTTAWGGVLKVG
jgi:hypothetical protein